jgi:HAD superfamily, subfamily IIIB (Acid phosphatase)
MLGRRRLRTLLAPAGVAALMLTLLAAGAAPVEAAPLPSEKQWLKDVDQAMAGSGSYLDRTVKGKHKKFAINLDIDNSSLATHYEPGTAVARVLSFVEHAHRHGVAILFNTARNGDPLTQARSDLESAGFPVTKVCGRRLGEGSAHGKRRCRRHFIASGYRIIANVGNRETDFSGAKNYGRAYRLPNYHNRLS